MSQELKNPLCIKPDTLKCALSFLCREGKMVDQILNSWLLVSAKGDCKAWKSELSERLNSLKKK